MAVKDVNCNTKTRNISQEKRKLIKIDELMKNVESLSYALQHWSFCPNPRNRDRGI